MSDDITRPFPHAVGPEKSVLSTLLQQPSDFIPRAIELGISEDHFYLPNHRVIFVSIMEGYDAGQPIELVSFIQRLIDTGRLEKCGGASVIADINGYAVGAFAFEKHASILTEKLILRSLLNMTSEVTKLAYESTDDPQAVLAEADRILTAITELANGPSPILTTKRVIGESFAAYKERLDGKVSPMGIATLPEIDHLIRGIHPGRVYIIGAYSGGGKSVLSSQIITLQALEGTPVLEINYEMTERDSMDRKLIQLSRVPSQAFMDPLQYAKDNDCTPINEGFMRDLTRTKDELLKAPIFIRKPQNSQLRTLVSLIRKQVRENGIKVVAIDYLQRIRQKSHSPEGEITEISHALQELAGELSISILLLSQLNDKGDTKHGIVAIEDCDAYFVIEQERNKELETFGQHFDILLAKDRHCGNQGRTIPLIFDPRAVRFVHGFVAKPKRGGGGTPVKKKP